MSGQRFILSRLPPLAGPQQDGFVRPTARFRSEYKQRVAFLTKVFPEKDNPQSVYPPATAEDFIRQCYACAPQLQQNLMRELWTLLREIDRSRRIVNGWKLYDHQLAHLIWTALSLVSGKDSPKSFFIEGAPGTGKTLTLGIILQACIRLQLRGLLPGKLAYCTAKGYHLPGKIRGTSMSRRRILRAPPYDPTPQDINRFRLAFRKIDGRFMDAYFRKRDWAALFAERVNSEVQARQLLEQSLSDRDLLGELHTEGDSSEMLDKLAKVLAGRATIVKGPNGTPDLLEVLPPAEDSGDVRIFTGDASFAIPTSNYPVYANASLGLPTSEPKDAKLILVPARLFTSTQQFDKLKDDLHRHIRVVFCDEAQRRNRMTFQEPVYYAGSRHLPLVFAAGSRWYERDWGRRSPRHSFPESIRRGVLPDIGVRVFPSAKAVHYPAETKEAIDQVVREYFKTLVFFQELNIPQPHDSCTLLVVHGKLTGLVTQRLRDEFRKRAKSTAQVWSYTGNEQDREAFQSWFVTERDGPNVLVSSPGIVKDTLDFPTIRHLVIATRVSADGLYHLIGRLAHSKCRANSSDRVLISLQQFANSNLRATPFFALDHGQDLSTESFHWVSGHALISERAFRKDCRKTKEKKYATTLVPMPAVRSKNSSSPIKVGEGTFLVPPRKTSRARYPMQHVLTSDRYDPSAGPPSRSVVQNWACECDATELFARYASILLIAEEAHQNGDDPRAAVERKIAQLRERASRME